MERAPLSSVTTLVRSGDWVKVAMRMRTMGPLRVLLSPSRGSMRACAFQAFLDPPAPVVVARYVRPAALLTLLHVDMLYLDGLDSQFSAP